MLGLIGSRLGFAEGENEISAFEMFSGPAQVFSTRLIVGTSRGTDSMYQSSFFSKSLIKKAGVLDLKRLSPSQLLIMEPTYIVDSFKKVDHALFVTRHEIG